MEESLDSIDDQESKLEEGKSCVESEKRLYQGRRRHLLRRDRDAAASEAKEEEAKEDEKEETTARVEESKDCSLSPLPSRSSDRKNIDTNDEEKLAPRTFTSSSSTYLRKPVEEKLKGKFQRRLLTSASVDLIPEVHFLGEISEGVGFRGFRCGTSISCKW
jgi:septal ring factor EnvC (AmiA/AmiB activator)